MRLDGDGIRVTLPPAWEGSITRNPTRTRSPMTTLDAEGRSSGTTSALAPIEQPVTHLANFALPAVLDVFGSEAVEFMQVGDGFVALVEYGPDEVDTPLFERRGLPRRLTRRDFSPSSLNRSMPDQLGTQVFATEGGRAFCLYVVLAGRAVAPSTIRAVNDVLSSLEVQPR